MKNRKVILITGASSGMGKVTAERLAQDGHIVYGAARRVEEMEELKKLGGYPIYMDLKNDESIVSAVQKIISEQNHIDVLINNAGFGLYGSVEDTPIEEARQQFEVNLFGMGRLTQLVAPFMRNHRSGKVINISSMGGRMYTPLGAWYHATKHAVEGFSDCLRLELKPFGIDVIIIEPGIIQTEFGNVMLNPLAKRAQGGAYEEITNKMIAATKTSYTKSKSSSPHLIAQTISKVINIEKPKTRYLVGKMAKPLVWMRKWFGDKTFDAIIMTQVK